MALFWNILGELKPLNFLSLERHFRTNPLQSHSDDPIRILPNALVREIGYTEPAVRGDTSGADHRLLQTKKPA